MELPIYNTLKEFKENYEIHYIPESYQTKLLFLKAYFDKYSLFYETETEVTPTEKYIDLRNRIELSLSYSERLSLNHFIEAIILFDDMVEHDTAPNNVYELLKTDLGTPAKYKELITEYVDKTINLELVKSIEEQRNIGILQIIDFINDEIEIEKRALFRITNTQQPIESFEIPEYDYSGKNELKPKEKLILLDKLGIVELLNEKLTSKGNATHLAEIIGAITGIDTSKGTLTGYCNYLSGLRPDDTARNSPYNSESTRNEAMRVFNSFKINADT